MADLAAGDVTYTLQGKAVKGEDGRRKQVVKVAFGDGALLYPSGGIPLSSLSNHGFPNVIAELTLIDANDGSGYVWKYDYENNKLRAYQSAAASHGHTLFLNNADVADSAGARVNAGTNLLGANTGSDVSIAGVANTSGSGGIVNATIAAGALVELGNVAVAAQVLYASVIGY